MKYLLTLIVCSTITIKSTAQSRLQDSLALVSIYDNVNGKNWTNNTNWKTTMPINTWYGVGIPFHSDTGRVTGLTLSNNNLIGDLSSTLIGTLSSLESLDLSYNQINGSIPTSLGSLSKLFSIELNNNNLTGTIPDTLGSLVYLQTLHLEYNNLNGKIPNTLGVRDSSGGLPGGMQLNNNEFTFAGMEAKAAAVTNGKDTLPYSPQANIRINQSGNTLSVSVGGTPINNTYLWYKIGSGLIAKIIADSTFTPITSGSYVVVVNNSVANKLTLYSDTVITGVLAITLMNFTAQHQNKIVKLNWQTTNQIDASSFNIQRSTDGVNFTDIGKVYSINNGSFLNNYSFTDSLFNMAIQQASIYYRLQEVDKNNSIIYGKIILLKLLNNSFEFQIYPNPMKDFLHLQFWNLQTSALINIFNINGQRVFSRQFNRISNGELQLDVSNLPAGLYIMQIQANEQSKKQKIIKSE